MTDRLAKCAVDCAVGALHGVAALVAYLVVARYLRHPPALRR